tara:strand:- start:7749 stop:9119 length:1371 start_codon:yes stop_codon:yes gene_type:complete
MKKSYNLKFKIRYFIIFFICIFINNLNITYSEPTSTKSKKYNLIEVYNLAVINDQSIKAAYNQLRSSEFNKYVNLSPLLPQLNFTSNYQTENGKTKINDNSLDTSSNSRSFIFSLNQILFNYTLWQAHKKSSYDFDSQKMSFYISTQELIINTANRYFNIIKAQNNLISQEEEYKGILSQYKQTSAQYKVGIVAKVDLDNVKAKLATSKTRVIRSKTFVKNAIDELEILTNKQIKLINKYNHNNKLYKYNLDYNLWLEKAKLSNYNIKKSFYTKLSTNTDIKIVSGDFFPTVSFNGSYGGSKTNTKYQITPGYNHNKIYMISLSYPIFSSGNTYFSRKQAIYNYNKSKNNYNQTYREQTTNVDIYIRNIKTDLSKISSLKQELKSEKAAVDAAKAGYQAGTRTMTEVLDQLSSYYNAQTQYYNSFYDYFLDTLKLKQVSGELGTSDIVKINNLLLT